MLALLAGLALSQSPASLPLRTVKLVPNFQTVEPLLVTLPRDQRLNLRVIVTAPSVESQIENLEIMAENQQPGYWVSRKGPNVFVKTERLDATGDHSAARSRVFSSGGGKSLREFAIQIDLEFLDTPEARKARIRAFFEKSDPSQDHGRIDAAVSYFARMYIANPPGRYEVTIKYEPKTGLFAGQSLGQRLIVIVNDGPDTLDRMSKVK